MNRPPVRRSIVAAVIEVIAGVRAGMLHDRGADVDALGMTASHTSGVTESEP